MSYVPGHIIRRWYARDLRLTELGFNSYDAYLRSPHWQAVKARFRASSERQVCMCGAVDDLQLHHKTYERLGAEEVTDLALLCPQCHSAVHVLERRGDMGLDFDGLESEVRAAEYAVESAPKRRQAREDWLTPERRKCEARSLARRVRQAVLTGELAGERLAEVEALVANAEAEQKARARAQS